MDNTQFAVRVRRGAVEVEVRGSEKFVREYSSELIDQYLSMDHANEPEDEGNSELRRRSSSSSGQLPLLPAAIPNPSVPPVALTFRDMLNSASNPTVAEKVLLAGYFLMSEGKDGFDATTAGELFESAYESKPNFSRELERAAKRGWLTRTRGDDPRRLTFRLTHRGIEEVRKLMSAQEAL